MPRRLAVTYERDPKTCGQKMPYEQKFANLVKLCEEAKAERLENVIVTWPWVLGDTYEELLESLSRFADAGLTIHVVERSPKSRPQDVSEIRH